MENLKRKTSSLLPKLNNSHIVLAILLLAIFVIFLSLSIALLVQPYFCDLNYVGYYRSDEDYRNRTIKFTIKFEEYGNFYVTSTENYNGLRQPTQSDSGTYEFVTRYSDKSYFELEGFWSYFYYNNAFQLEYSGIVLTNVSAICLVIFYLAVTIGSLTCAIILLVRRKNGKKVFVNVVKLQARIDELEKQVDDLKKDE